MRAAQLESNSAWKRILLSGLVENKSNDVSTARTAHDRLPKAAADPFALMESSPIASGLPGSAGCRHGELINSISFTYASTKLLFYVLQDCCTSDKCMSES